MEIGTDYIKYKKFNYQDGPTYSIPKEEVFMIKYQNGDKDVFNKIENKQVQKGKKTVEKSNETQEEYQIKGFHIGSYSTLGVGDISNDNYKLGFSYGFDLDFNYFFNNFWGLSIGGNFFYLPVHYKYEGIG